MPPKSRNARSDKNATNNPKNKLQELFQKAVILHQNGRLKQAEKIYLKILKSEPGHFHSLHLLGVISYQAGNHRKAANLIKRAIEIFPTNASFYINLGLSLQELGQLDAALENYDKAIELNSRSAEAYSNRGNTLALLHRFESAITSYDQAIAINPAYATAHYNRGNALKELMNFESALESFENAIAITPQFAEAYNNRGLALLELKKPTAALESFNKALSIDPDFAEAHNGCGIALQDLNQHGAALDYFNKAIALKPNISEPYNNRGVSYHDLKQLNAALENFDKAIQINQDFSEAYFNKSHTLLLGGNFDEGFKLYEHRWLSKKTGLKERIFSQPLWLGKEPLSTKTILLHSEQGQGDAIQFCRYAPLVAELGANVIIETSKSLSGLFRGLSGVSDVIEKGDPLPAFDYHCPFLSLPLAFKADLKTIPHTQKYLSSNAKKILNWEEKLGKKLKPRIGLVWSSTSQFKGDSTRSMVLSSFMEILSDIDCEFVCLQKEIKDIDKPTLDNYPAIRVFSDELNDFSDTAALIDCLDIVVSTCTSVPHLSCALGKPTWILLSYVPDWRWLLDRDDSPWYPTAKLYRQESPGDWDGVLSKV